MQIRHLNPIGLTNTKKTVSLAKKSHSFYFYVNNSVGFFCCCQNWLTKKKQKQCTAGADVFTVIDLLKKNVYTFLDYKRYNHVPLVFYLSWYWKTGTSYLAVYSLCNSYVSANCCVKLKKHDQLFCFIQILISNKSCDYMF